MQLPSRPVASSNEVVVMLPPIPHPKVSYLLQLALSPELLSLSAWNPEFEVQYFPASTVFSAEANSPPSHVTREVLRACSLQRLILELETRHQYFTPPPPPSESDPDEVLPSVETDEMDVAFEEDGGGYSDWYDDMEMDIRGEWIQDEQEIADYLCHRHRMREITPPSDVESMIGGDDIGENGQNQTQIPNEYQTWPFVNVINQQIIPSDDRFSHVEIGDHAMGMLQTMFALPNLFNPNEHGLTEISWQWNLNETVMAKWTAQLSSQQMAKVESQLDDVDVNDDVYANINAALEQSQDGQKPIPVTTWSGGDWRDISTAEDAIEAFFGLFVDMIHNPRELTFRQIVEQSRLARLLLFDLQKAITELYFQLKPDSQATITSLGSQRSPLYSPIRSEDFRFGSEVDEKGNHMTDSDSDSATSEYVKIKQENDDDEQDKGGITPSSESEESHVSTQVPASLTAQQMDEQIDIMLALRSAIEVWADTGFSVPVPGYRILPLLAPRSL